MKVERSPGGFERDRAWAIGGSLLSHLGLLGFLWAGLGASGRSSESAMGEGSTTTVEFVTMATLVPSTPPATLEQADDSASHAPAAIRSADTAVEVPLAPDGEEPASSRTGSATPVQMQGHGTGSPTDSTLPAHASASITQVAGPLGSAGSTLDDGLEARYLAALRQTIKSHWAAPKSGKAGGTCSITIRQVPGGQVHSALSAECTLDQASRHALEAAALMAQPLPYQGFESVFRSEIVLELSSH